MTTATDLTTLVGSDGVNFSASQKSSAITLAQKLLGTSDGDSDLKDLATAMLAQRILMNQLKSADEQQELSDLITDEIRSFVTDPDDFQSDESVFVVDTDQPTETWY